MIKIEIITYVTKMYSLSYWNQEAIYSLGKAELWEMKQTK